MTLTDTQRELITWLIAVVPTKYLPPSIQQACTGLRCGSLDGLQEILEMYVTGDDGYALGYQFKTMTRAEILAYADDLDKSGG